MSEIFAEQLAAVANTVLAVLAIATAALALLAWRKQSKEVSDQAAMLDLQRRQLAEQEKTSAKQAEVLELQARELRESLDERKRAAEEKRGAQAAQVTAWFGQQARTHNNTISDWGALVRNASGLPVFDIRVSFDWIYDQPGGQEWTAVPYGSLPGPVTIVPPDTTRHFLIPDNVRSQDPRCDDEVYAVSITFTDAAGRRWHRDARGALKPLS